MTLDHLFVNGGDTAIVEDGERVGTLQDDGSFLITATRTVTFAGWEGKVLATEEVPLFSAATAPEVVAPEGYRFTGWDVDFSHVVQDLAVTAQFEKLPDPPQPELFALRRRAGQGALCCFGIDVGARVEVLPGSQEARRNGRCSWLGGSRSGRLRWLLRRSWRLR